MSRTPHEVDVSINKATNRLLGIRGNEADDACFLTTGERARRSTAQYTIPTAAGSGRKPVERRLGGPCRAPASSQYFAR
jgi:hypothetical protein